MSRFDHFERDWDRFDAFAHRDPSRLPDQECEVRSCEMCGEPLATDERKHCALCIAAIKEEDAFHGWNTID